MNTFKKILLLTTFLICLCACPNEENGHQHITIINNSDKTIIWQARFFKDSFIDKQFACQYTYKTICSNTSVKFNYDDRENVWETAMDKHYLQILFADYDTFKKYETLPCDTIRKHVPILYCYILTLEDLQRMNWTVVYPPVGQHQ